MNREPSRTRNRGTVVTVPKDGAERIAAIRQIVDRKSYAKVDGCMLDLTTAHCIISVYDALSEPNQAKYANCTAPRMAEIAFKLAK